MRKAISISERLRAGCEVDAAGCWIWVKSIDPGGYGRIFTGTRAAGNRRPSLAYRVSYETFIGPIPEGLVLDHLCRVRACINPEHLEPVTMRVNVLRGISLAAENALKDACLHGHRFTAENTMRDKYGKRYCLTCRKRHIARQTERRRADRQGSRPQ